jgi:hypothetical protein
VPLAQVLAPRRQLPHEEEPRQELQVAPRRRHPHVQLRRVGLHVRADHVAPPRQAHGVLGWQQPARERRLPALPGPQKGDDGTAAQYRQDGGTVEHTLLPCLGTAGGRQAVGAGSVAGTRGAGVRRARSARGTHAVGTARPSVPCPRDAAPAWQASAPCPRDAARPWQISAPCPRDAARPWQTSAPCPRDAAPAWQTSAACPRDAAPAWQTSAARARSARSRLVPQPPPRPRVR